MLNALHHKQLMQVLLSKEANSTNAKKTMIQTQSEALDKTITHDKSLDGVHNNSVGPEAFS